MQPKNLVAPDWFSTMPSHRDTSYATGVDNNEIYAIGNALFQLGINNFSSITSFTQKASSDKIEHFETFSEAVPEAETVSEAVSEAMPEATSETASETASEIILGAMSEAATSEASTEALSEASETTSETLFVEEAVSASKNIARRA